MKKFVWYSITLLYVFCGLTNHAQADTSNTLAEQKSQSKTHAINHFKKTSQHNTSAAKAVAKSPLKSLTNTRLVASDQASSVTLSEPAAPQKNSDTQAQNTNTSTATQNPSETTTPQKNSSTQAQNTNTSTATQNPSETTTPQKNSSTQTQSTNTSTATQKPSETNTTQKNSSTQAQGTSTSSPKQPPNTAAPSTKVPETTTVNSIKKATTTNPSSTKSWSTKSKHTQQPIETVTVKFVDATKALTYQSTMRPVVESIVNSPANGKIFKAHKDYGDTVTKNDLIINISSREARNELMSNVSSLLSTQTSYATSMSNLKKNVELQNKGIISEQELTASQNEFIQSLIEMTRAKLQFEKTAKLLGFDEKKIESISINKNINMILKSKESTEKLMKQILSNEYTVGMKAKTSGTFLPPIGVSGDSKAIQLKPGAEVENRQNIGIIANPNTVEMHLNISEFDIVKMQIGQEVSVVVPALQNKKLKGEIVQIRRFDYQPRQGQIPTIPVVAKAFCTDCDQLYSISCNATIIEPKNKSLQVPISAVKKENNTYYVEKMINNKPVKTKVDVGSTTKTSITIKSGLQQGDKVVKNYSSG